MYEKVIKIGTRASKLALIQAQSVKDLLIHSGYKGTCELVKIKTKGDRILDAPLATVGGKGLFVKEIEDALLKKQIDMAVHSMKDVPTEIVDDLCIGAVPRRFDARDVLVSERKTILKHLPKEAIIGTCSLRRQSQILHYCPSFQIVQLRGNLETRLRRVGETDIDAVILAAAGIHRMGLEDVITEYFPIDFFLPAIAQGAIGIQIRKNDKEMEEIVRPLDHHHSRLCVDAERAFLEKLEGSCQVPIAGYAQIKGKTMTLEGLVGSINGRRIIRDSISGDYLEGKELGSTLAEKILAQGADAILREIFDNNKHMYT
ncbi:MAG: hydroxymethylbilane synthase [bacterium]